MPEIPEPILYKTFFGQQVPIGQHAGADGKPRETGVANPLPVTGELKLSGSNMEHFGKSTTTKPANNSVPVGATFFEIDTKTAYMNDGTSWVVI